MNANKCQEKYTMEILLIDFQFNDNLRWNLKIIFNASKQMPGKKRYRNLTTHFKYSNNFVRYDRIIVLN